jgi:hypothetical protein
MLCYLNGRRWILGGYSGVWCFRRSDLACYTLSFQYHLCCSVIMVQMFHYCRALCFVLNRNEV